MPRTSLILAVFLIPAAASADTLRVGFGDVEITPEVNGPQPVWIAGYGHGRRAEGVHDPLMARCVVLDDGSRRMAWVSVDVVGLQYPTVQRIRGKLDGFHYVLVASTHNHEGPDTIGIWGRTPLESGVDLRYLGALVDKVAGMVRQAAEKLQPALAFYGTAEDETLLGDSRQPIVKDGVLRAIRFQRAEEDRTLGILVQWNCHPESLGSKNKLLTADFPWATVAALKKRYNCPIVYFSGAVGGLMGLPDGVVRSAEGQLLPEGDFEFARVYGELVAGLAAKAIDGAKPLDLTPLVVSARPIAIPIANPLYQAARTLGVIPRDGRVWTGDAERLGEPIQAAAGDVQVALETEVAYLRLGDLHVACIPGEIYPELVYGRFQDPVEPGADYPEAPLETHVMKLLPGEKTLLFGLANDEVGYIIPKRQWDQRPPFCYGRKTSQYGEINSCGPDVAPIVMKALENRVREMK
jgi:hypothetical protein